MRCTRCNNLLVISPSTIKEIQNTLIKSVLMLDSPEVIALFEDRAIETIDRIQQIMAALESMPL